MFMGQVRNTCLASLHCLWSQAWSNEGMATVQCLCNCEAPSVLKCGFGFFILALKLVWWLVGSSVFKLPSHLLLSSVILPFILLVLLVLLLFLLLLGLLLLAEAYEVTLVVHRAGVMADGDDGWGPGDDEGFGRDLSGLQGLRGAVGLSGAVFEVPAVAVDTSTYRGRKLPTTLTIYTSTKKKENSIIFTAAENSWKKFDILRKGIKCSAVC